MSFVNKNIKSVEKILNRALGNEYINVTIKVLLALYAALAAPKLPKVALRILNSTPSRILVSFLIVFMATQDPGIALLISIAFVITIQTANKLNLYDTALSKGNNISWLPSSQDEKAEDDHVEAEASEDNQLPHASKDQLLKMQNNMVPGSDQNQCVKGWKDVEQHCIQGLDNPSGNPDNIVHGRV